MLETGDIKCTKPDRTLTGGSWTKIEALRHWMYTELLSVSILVSWKRNSATGWGGAPICMTMVALLVDEGPLPHPGSAEGGGGGERGG